MRKTKVAIIGSGNIGTDLLLKILRQSDTLQMGVMVGIDPESDGLARARTLGVETTDQGVAGLLSSPQFGDIEIVFDATSAVAHKANAKWLAPHNKRLIDLTPAAIGPYAVPVVNLDEHLNATNINMVTCGGQATIPIVAAVSESTTVLYAEIIASIASRSAGPGTRANIDEFTKTTALAIQELGGAARGKAMIVLNPAEPPMIMRDTVHTVSARLDDDAKAQVREAISHTVAAVAKYVPGYRLKQEVQFVDAGAELDILVPEGLVHANGYTRTTVFLEVEGAAMYLPPYAGNLDIMTSAALQTAERVASTWQQKVSAT